MGSCRAWACWPSAFLISVRKWQKKPQMSHNRWLESDEQHFSFDNMKKQPTRKLFLRIKHIHCSVGRKALGKPNRPLLSIHWPQKRPWGNTRSPGLDVIGLIPWTRRKLDWVTVCPITRRSAIESAAATLYFLTSPAATTAATWEMKNTHRHGADVCVCVMNVKVLRTWATTCCSRPSLHASPGILGISAAAEVGKQVKLMEDMKHTATPEAAAD